MNVVISLGINALCDVDLVCDVASSVHAHNVVQNIASFRVPFADEMKRDSRPHCTNTHRRSDRLRDIGAGNGTDDFSASRICGEVFAFSH